MATYHKDQTSSGAIVLARYVDIQQHGQEAANDRSILLTCFIWKASNHQYAGFKGEYRLNGAGSRELRHLGPSGIITSYLYSVGVQLYQYSDRTCHESLQMSPISLTSYSTSTSRCTLSNHYCRTASSR